MESSVFSSFRSSYRQNRKESNEPRQSNTAFDKQDDMFDDQDGDSDDFNDNSNISNSINQNSNTSRSSRRVPQRRRQDIMKEIGDIDPFILEKQEDWGDIYDNEAIVEDPRLKPRPYNYSKSIIAYSKHIRSTFSPEEILDLVSVWFNHAKNGSFIMYPNTQRQLWFYKLYSSQTIAFIINLTTGIELLCPLLEQPYCHFETFLSTNQFFANGYPSRLSLTTIALITVLIQIACDPVLLALSSPPQRYLNRFGQIQVDHSRVWTILRICILLAQFFDCILFFGNDNGRRATRCLTPILIIARRQNFKQIVEGVIRSFYFSFGIYQGLIAILFLWGLAGYCLFTTKLTIGDDDIPQSTQGDAFTTIFKSVYTALHCFISRPSVLYRIDNLNNSNPTSTAIVYVYFISLTLVADILVGSLIIATGTRYFRDFSSLNYRARLRYRREALRVIFLMVCEYNERSSLSDPSVFSMKTRLSDDKSEIFETKSANSESSIIVSSITKSIEHDANESTISIEKWESIVKALSYGQITDQSHIKQLFSLEDRGPVTLSAPVNLQSFSHSSPRSGPVSGNIHRLSPSVDRKVLNRSNPEKEEKTVEPNIQANEARDMLGVIWSGYINEKQFFRLAGVIASKVRFRDDRVELDRLKVTANVAKATPRLSLSSNTIPAGIQAMRRFSNRRSSNTSQSNMIELSNMKSSITQDNPMLDNTMLSTSMGKNETDSSDLKSSNKSIISTKSNDQLSNLWETVLIVMAKLNYTEISVSIWLPPILSSTIDTYVVVVKVIDIVDIILHIVLIPTMAVLAGNNPDYASYVCNWIIWMLFSVDMIIRSFSLELSRATLLNKIVLNLLNGLLLIILRTPDHSSISNVNGNSSFQLNQVALTFVIIVQTFRYVKFLRLLRGAETLYAVVPIIGRSFILLGFIIYFFGTLAHVSLCDKLDSNSIEYVGDDDSQAWTKFSNILNFSSYLQAMYTLAQLTVLSSWSIVMDAAVLSQNVENIDSETTKQATKFSIYFFFITFRILMVLIILPILLSFIIQSFIQQLRKPKARKILESDINASNASSGLSKASKGSSSIIVGDGGRMQIYRVVSNTLYSSSMVSIWSSGGRETVARPIEKKKLEAKIVMLKERRSFLQRQLYLLQQECIDKLLDSTSRFEFIKSKKRIDQNILRQDNPDHLLLLPIIEIAEATIYREQVSWGEMLLSQLPSILQRIQRYETHSISMNRKGSSDRFTEMSKRWSKTLFGGWSDWGSEVVEYSHSIDKPNQSKRVKVVSIVGSGQGDILPRDSEMSVDGPMRETNDHSTPYRPSSSTPIPRSSIGIHRTSNVFDIDKDRNDDSEEELGRMSGVIGDSIDEVSITNDNNNVNDNSESNQPKKDGDIELMTNTTIILSMLPPHLKLLLPEFLKNSTIEERKRLAAIWFYDGTHGRKVALSLKKGFIFWYAIGRTKILSSILYMAIGLQILLSLFASPLCLRASDQSSFLTLSNTALTIFDFLLLPLYFGDVVIDYYIGLSTRKSDLVGYISSWTCLRLITLVLIFLDCLVFFGSSSGNKGGRLSRALFPFLIISRDTNLRKILHGLYKSFRKSKLVYLLLGGLLFLWTLFGYFLFQRINISSQNRFSTLYKAFGTILQCFSSAPFSLFVLQPYVSDYSKGTEFFFLGVTLTTELLATNLIVAVGNAALTKFAEKTVKVSTTFRLAAMLAIWTLFTSPSSDKEYDRTSESIVNGRMSLHRWLDFCDAVNDSYGIDRQSAIYLFQYIILQRNSILSDSLSSNHTIDNSTKSYTELEKLFHQCYNMESYNQYNCQIMCGDISDVYDRNSINLFEFIRLLGILSLGIRMESYEMLLNPKLNYPILSYSVLNDTISISDTSSTQNNSKDSKGIELNTFTKMSVDNNSTIPSSEKSMSSHPIEQKLRIEIRENRSTYIEIKCIPKIFQNLAKTIYKICVTILSLHMEINIYHTILGVSKLFHILLYYPKLYMTKLCSPIKNSTVFYYPTLWCTILYHSIEPTLQSIVLTSKRSYHISLISAIAYEMRILLIVAMIYITGESTEYTFRIWIRILWLLEAYFWIEMMMFLVSIGEIAFVRDPHHEFSAIVNIGSLVCLIVVGLSTPYTLDEGTRQNSINTALSLLILFQCIRLTTVFWFTYGLLKPSTADSIVEASNISSSDFAKISMEPPNMRYGFKLVRIAYMRILFLLGSVIYTFSIFSQQAYCGLLNSTSVGSESNTDDDSSSWLNFSNILIFDTYLQAFFTMFEVMVLGSWSMVMDAANKVVHITPYFFFFTYRLGMTLVLLPLLLSFVIRAYIMAQDQYQQQLQQYQEQQESCKSFDNRTNVHDNSNDKKIDSNDDSSRYSQASPSPPPSPSNIQSNIDYFGRVSSIKPDNVVRSLNGIWDLDISGMTTGGTNKNSMEYKKMCILSVEIENIMSAINYYNQLKNSLESQAQSQSQLQSQAENIGKEETE